MQGGNDQAHSRTTFHPLGTTKRKEFGVDQVFGFGLEQMSTLVLGGEAGSESIMLAPNFPYLCKDR